MTQENKKYPTIEHMFDINKYYPEFYQFMGQFCADADSDIFDEEYTIKNSYEACDRDYQNYLKVKSQAEELMNMEPFPYDEIENSADRFISKGAKDENEKIEKVKQWLIKVLDLLEKRVTGKL